MPTLEIIRGWLNEAVKKKATHLIIVCDDFDGDDYPSYVLVGQNITDRIKHYEQAKMQRIIEIYNMGMDLEAQLNEKRAYNL